MSSFRTSQPSSPSLRQCKFGCLCIKFGCPFVHPPSRPRDCPDGEFCTEVKCPLHHPRSRPIKQYKQENCPCALSFAELGTSPPRHPMSRPSSRTMRYSNRMITRSPMVIPSPNSRPTTGYFAATTKPCAHGAACTKYGCTYKHPASRAADCPVGMSCTDKNCALRHPLNEHGTGATDAGFAVGDRVLAKFLPNSTNWSHAEVRYIRGSTLTLQFNGFADTFKLPLRRVTHLSSTNDKYTPASPCTPPPKLVTQLSFTNDKYTPASPCTPPPERPPSSLRDVNELQRLKRAAVLREDFLAAAQIKRRIDTVEKIAHLEQRKQKAVCDEDFLMAMALKKQIAALQSEESTPISPSSCK